jgi:hypothetical protein
VPQVLVPLSTAIEIIQRVLELSDDGLPALKARMRQMTDMGVPSAGRGKAHERLRYGLVELTEVTTALVLSNAWMPPSAAVAYVREGWKQLAPLAVAGIGSAASDGYVDALPRRAVGSYAVIEGGSLKDLGKRRVREAATETAVSDVVTVSDETAVSKAVGASAASIVLNTAAYMPTVVRELAKRAIEPGDVIDSIDALRLSERTVR